MNNYCAFSKEHHCIKWQDYVSARLELEECDELCHGNWIEIESLQQASGTFPEKASGRKRHCITRRLL